MRNRALSPILSVLGALLLAFVVGVFSASPFGERDVAHAQQITGPTLATLGVTVAATTETATAWAEREPVPLSPTVPDKLDEEKSYTARVPNGVSQVTVAPTSSDGTVGDITPADADTGTTGHQVDLSVGTTTIRIPVTAGGDSNTYIVRVTRVQSSASSDTKLSSLSLSNVTLSPAFDSEKREYSDRVQNSVNLTTVTARVANSGATVDIRYAATATFNTTDFDGTGMGADSANVVPLNESTAGEGDPTTIAIRVTAADVSTVDYYTVTVTRAPTSSSTTNDAKLAGTGLALTGVNLSPSYDADKTAYTASVPYNTDSTEVTATAADEGAMVTLTSDMDDDVEDTNTTATNIFASPVKLVVGANVITVKVEAEDAIATKTYTVTVTRAAATASADANLASLTLSRVTLSPAFDPGKTAYSDRVQNSVNLTIVTASAANSGAVVDIKYAATATFDTTDFDGTGMGADSANVVPLNESTAGEGDPTTIAIRVTAADGVNDEVLTP